MYVSLVSYTYLYLYVVINVTYIVHCMHALLSFSMLSFELIISPRVLSLVITRWGGQPLSFSDMRLLWGDGVGSCRGSRKNLHPFRIFSVKSPWLSELAFWQLLQTVCCNLKCHKNRFICLYCRVQLSKYVLCMLEHAWVHFNSHTYTYTHTQIQTTGLSYSQPKGEE